MLCMRLHRVAQKVICQEPQSQGAGEKRMEQAAARTPGPPGALPTHREFLSLAAVEREQIE